MARLIWPSKTPLSVALLIFYIDFIVFAGMSLLHLAILSEKFSFVRVILDHIDLTLNIKSVGQNIQDEAELHKVLQNHIVAYTSEKIPNIKFDPIKLKILNQKNIKSGRTPLFLAISLSSELLSFLLMGHGADPRIEDLSGNDCSSLTSEILSNKLISTAVYNTSTFLKQYEIIQTIRRNEKSKIGLRGLNIVRTVVHNYVEPVILKEKEKQSRKRKTAEKVVKANVKLKKAKNTTEKVLKVNKRGTKAYY